MLWGKVANNEQQLLQAILVLEPSLSSVVLHGSTVVLFGNHYLEVGTGLQLAAK